MTISAKDLIAKVKEMNEQNKQKAEKKATRKLCIKRLGITVVIEEADKDFMDDFKLKKLYSSLSPEELKAFNEELVYNYTVEPNLRDEELIAGLAAKADPIKVVNKIFELDEVVLISNQIFDLSGSDISKDAVTVVDDVKN